MWQCWARAGPLMGVLQLPCACSCRSGRGCRGGGKCRLLGVGYGQAVLKCQSAGCCEVTTSEEPEPDSLLWAPWWDGAGAWSRHCGCFSAGVGTPSAPPEPGQIAPAEECCRNPPADVQCCSRRLYIPEMYPACWCAGREACGSGVKADECLGAVNILPVPGIQFVLEDGRIAVSLTPFMGSAAD